MAGDWQTRKNVNLYPHFIGRETEPTNSFNSRFLFNGCTTTPSVFFSIFIVNSKGI